MDERENPLSLSTDITVKPLSLQTLASLRSLIINPSTTESTLSSILETLTRSLQLTPDSLTLHHTLKLLSDLASLHPHLAPPIVDSVRSHSFSAGSTRLAAESVAALASVVEHNRTLVPSINELDDQFFVSLCFGPSVSVRLWLLRNAERFRVRPYVLFTVFLGFTKDPYPYVRRVALDGLVRLCKCAVFEDCDVIEGCYCRAVELLSDSEDCVRSAAVRTVSEWGQMLVASSHETNKRDRSDAVFVQLCSMVRDLSMEVRVDAFNALGKMGMVSEDILLQTIYKKVLSVSKQNKSLSRCTTKPFDVLARSTAGVFVHGLEDEYYEVRRSACSSLRTLTILSTQFATEVLNLLMDVLNDDSVVVRLQALETMHHMATCDCLMVQETHMHMFLGTLVDNSSMIRASARKILKLVKLGDLELFRVCIDGLLENLDRYPQDEADVFSVLFNIGRNHGNFTVCIIKEVSQQIEPTSETSEGQLGFDSARVAALLVLAISAPLSHVQHVHSIPPRIFSCAVTFLGRISSALSDVMNQNTLLSYLFQCSRSLSFSATEINNKEGETFLSAIKDVPNFPATEIISTGISDGVSVIQSLIPEEPREVATSHAECLLETHEEITKSMSLILAKIKYTWPFIQSGSTNTVLRTLRGCKEELAATFSTDLLGSASSSAFTLQYIHVMKLLAKVWRFFLPATKFHPNEMGELNLLLGKLDRRLREMRCRFFGFSKEEELHILELILVTCIFRLSKFEMCCHLTTLKKLSGTISRVQFLHNGGSIELSNFVMELSKSLCENGTSLDGASCSPVLFQKLLDCFSLKQFVFCGRLKHVRAELDIPDNDSENPLPFVSGLPVAIPLEITLHNVLSDNRLWLRMTMSEKSTQFHFLDLELYEGSNEVRKFTFDAPFYRTPKAISLTLRICIGMECLFEDVGSVKYCRGPSRELAYLCKEKEVYLSGVT